eukprot:9991131-Alexandrium_andersonii.AAC.1
MSRAMQWYLGGLRISPLEGGRWSDTRHALVAIPGVKPSLVVHDKQLLRRPKGSRPSRALT